MSASLPALRPSAFSLAPPVQHKVAQVRFSFPLPLFSGREGAPGTAVRPTPCSWRPGSPRATHGAWRGSWGERGGEGRGRGDSQNGTILPVLSSPRRVPASCGLGGAGAGEWGFPGVFYPSRLSPSSCSTVNPGFVIIASLSGGVTSLCGLSTPGAPPWRGWGARHGAQCDAGGPWPAPRGALLPPPPPMGSVAISAEGGVSEPAVFYAPFPPSGGVGEVGRENGNANNAYSVRW